MGLQVPMLHDENAFDSGNIIKNQRKRYDTQRTIKHIFKWQAI